ncbi:GntR family transcriptional regulator [Sesbania bispinosa]|nr:GntR family transcriptional regulator [Sesbania bispinosa]
MAENSSNLNTPHLTCEEVNVNGEDPNAKTLMTRQEQMDETLQLLVKKVVESNDKSTEVKPSEMNVGNQCEGRNIDQNQNTGHRTMNIDWDNIKLEPFASNDDGDFFVDVSDEECYYHDMGSKKNKLKVTKQSNEPRLHHITGTSFLKRENDLFYNKDKDHDLQVHATNFM